MAMLQQQLLIRTNYACILLIGLLFNRASPFSIHDDRKDHGRVAGFFNRRNSTI